MTAFHPTLAELAMQLAREVAAVHFRSEHDRTDLVHEAWLVARRGKGTPESCVRYAILRVRSERHFRQSKRSLTTLHEDRDVQEAKPKRIGFPESLASLDDDPADVAIAELSWDEWLATLNKQGRRMAVRMRQGWSNAQLASLFGITHGAVSQWRRKLWESFRTHLSD